MAAPMSGFSQLHASPHHYQTTPQLAPSYSLSTLRRDDSSMLLFDK
jgi:hypothetical protein